MLFRNELISNGLEPVLGYIEKSCKEKNGITENFPQIFLKIIKLIPVFFRPGLWPLGTTKAAVLILYYFILISAESCLLYDTIKNF